MVTLRVIIWHISIYVIYKFPSLSQNKIKTIIMSCFTKNVYGENFILENVSSQLFFPYF